MPYKKNEDLPDAVKNHLPEQAQTLFRKAFNSAHEEYEEEETAFKVAWSAVKKLFEKKGDQWVKRSD